MSLIRRNTACHLETVTDGGILKRYNYAILFVVTKIPMLFGAEYYLMILINTKRCYVNKIF